MLSQQATGAATRKDPFDVGFLFMRNLHCHDKKQKITDGKRCSPAPQEQERSPPQKLEFGKVLMLSVRTSLLALALHTLLLALARCTRPLVLAPRSRQVLVQRMTRQALALLAPRSRQALARCTH